MISKYLLSLMAAMVLGWESNAGPPLANKQEHQVMGGQDLTQKGINYFPTGLKFQQPICSSPNFGWWDTISDQSGLGMSWLNKPKMVSLLQAFSEPLLCS